MEFVFIYVIATIIITVGILTAVATSKIKEKGVIKSKNKPVSNKIFIYTITLFLIVVGYRSLKSDENINRQSAQAINNQTVTRAPTQEQQNLLKLGNENHWNGIKENGEVKFISDVLNRHCETDFCKIEHYFNYVKRIPYQEGEKNNDKNAFNVIVKDKGDCDEKSHLLASLMLQEKYETILIYTKDHAFAGVNIPNYKTKERKSYFTYNNKKYYYAETTDKNAEIGAYNGIDPKEFKHIYSVNEKKEIPLNQVRTEIYL